MTTNYHSNYIKLDKNGGGGVLPLKMTLLKGDGLKNHNEHSHKND